jgi:GNAT superfamily N-acetyltransferase
MTTNIRTATSADVPQILRFIRALAEYEHLSDEIRATEEALNATLFGAKRYAEVLLADWDGQPAGFALYYHNYSTFLAQPCIYLEDLFVDPPYRGRGVGKTLLKELARIAVERGCARLDWSALDWNRTAIEFYLRLGAVELSGWSLYRLAGEALRRMASQ